MFIAPETVDVGIKDVGDFRGPVEIFAITSFITKTTGEGKTEILASINLVGLGPTGVPSYYAAALCSSLTEALVKPVSAAVFIIPCMMPLADRVVFEDRVRNTHRHYRLGL